MKSRRWRHATFAPRRYSSQAPPRLSHRRVVQPILSVRKATGWRAGIFIIAAVVDFAIVTVAIPVVAMAGGGIARGNKMTLTFAPTEVGTIVTRLEIEATVGVHG